MKDRTRTHNVDLLCAGSSWRIFINIIPCAVAIMQEVEEEKGRKKKNLSAQVV